MPSMRVHKSEAGIGTYIDGAFDHQNVPEEVTVIRLVICVGKTF